MPPRTDALKRAQKNYIGKFARVEIRMEPEQRDFMQAHAADRKESINEFINRAIRETMEREKYGRKEQTKKHE